MATIASIDFKAFGIKELEAKFRKLPLRMQNKILRPSMRAGAKLVHQAAKSAVPKDTGLLRRSIILKAMKRSRTRIGFVVRTKGREHFGIDDKGKWYRPAIIEYGYVRHGITYPARSYLRATVERLRPTVLRRIGADIRTKLAAVAKKP